MAFERFSISADQRPTQHRLSIALGLGAGGESRRPPGLAVVGGLLVSRKLRKTIRTQDESALAKLPGLEHERGSA
jgi:hypothetical protein